MSRLPELEFHHYCNQDGLRRRIAELQASLAEVDPAEIATRTAADLSWLGEGVAELALPVLGQPVVVVVPGWNVLSGKSRSAVSLNTQALVLYHFCASNGAPAAGRWVAFRELPNGGFYHQAFQGYTGYELAKKFGNRLDVFVRAARALGGLSEAIGDAAFVFQALPRVAMMVVCWLGDEEFDPSVRILFDAAAGHHLPIDACALLGSTLTRRLIAQAN